LLAIAVVPSAAGIVVGGSGVDLDTGFNTAMYIAAGLCVLGGAVAWFTIRRAVPVLTSTRGDITMPCQPSCVALPAREPASEAA
jgi:hypothetical protein